VVKDGYDDINNSYALAILIFDFSQMHTSAQVILNPTHAVLNFWHLQHYELYTHSRSMIC